MVFSRPRVVLIGPSAERHRGGIAQFTSRLAEELFLHSDLRFISWEKLYPQSIIQRDYPGIQRDYPGLDSSLSERQATQRRNTTQARGAHAWSVPGEPILSISSMRSWRLAAETIAAFDPQLVFFTWSHPIHAPVYSYLSRKLASTTSAELVGICHNVLPHEDFRGARSVTRLALGKFDRLVVHGHSEEEQARSLFPQLPITTMFIPLFDFLVHPDFREQAKKLSTDPMAKHELRRPRNILYFGAIRKYKGIDVLLRAMPRVLAQMPNARLRIVGEPFFNRSSTLARLLGETANPLDLIDELGLSRVVSVQNRYVPDNEISGVFADVDLAVFPFRTPSLSASLMLAYAHGVPVVASRIGGFVDSVVAGETGYFAEANDPTSLAASIVHLLRNPIPVEQVYRATRNLTWSNYVTALLAELSGRTQVSDAERIAANGMR